MKVGMILGAVIASLALGAFGGWLLGATSVTGDHGDRSPPAGDRALGDLVPLVRQIAEELHQMRTALGVTSPASASSSSSSPPSPAREALSEQAAASPPDGDRLSSVLERLTALLEQRSSAGGGSTSPPVTTGAAPHPENVAVAFRTERESRARTHFFWTYQRMLDRYGPPERMESSSSGNLIWIYRDANAENELGFVFFDGFVIDSWG